MEIRLVIDDGLVKRARRLFSRRMMVIAAVCIAIGSSSYVYATSATPTHTFQPNTVISSSEVNQNFAELYQGVYALEQRNAAGMVTMFAGSTPPAGHLLCDGAEVSRTTYAALFAAIGTTYGAGDGSTTFNLPDLQGRVAVGLDSAQAGFNALAAVGGERVHALTTAEMPSHAHTGTTSLVADHTHTATAGNAGAHSHTVSLTGAQSSGTTTNPSGHAIPYARNLVSGQHADGAFDEMLLYNGGAFIQPPDWDFLPLANAGTATSSTVAAHNHSVTIAAGGGHSHSFTTAAAGSGAAHNVVQPYVVLNYIIAF